MTPSAPFFNARKIISGSTRPLHMTRTMRNDAGRCMREVPAPSAPTYEHQLQKIPRIYGVHSSSGAIDPASCSASSAMIFHSSSLYFSISCHGNRCVEHCKDLLLAEMILRYRAARTCRCARATAFAQDFIDAHDILVFIKTDRAIRA